MDAILRLAGFDLQPQLARLRAQAEDFKDRATDEVKRQVAATSITIGLAFVGLILALVTVIIGLIALYLWIAMQHGVFAGLGVAALATAILAALLFTIAASRGGRPARRPGGHASVAAAPSRPVASTRRASVVEAVTEKLSDRTAAAAEGVLVSADEMVRKGSRQTVFAALAIAAVAGLIIGRSRKAG